MLRDIVDAIGADGDDATVDGGRSARRIAAVIGRMITAGELPVGARLPTVRELSAQLGVSPTTVSAAWHSLADVGAIEPRGRNGTFVRPPTGPGGPRRYRRVTEGPGHFELDLSSGTPDPVLLPDLAPILSRVSGQTLTSNYLDHPVLPALEESLRANWPFAPEALTVVDGAMDALDRIAEVVLRLGDRVIVEHPSFPPLLDRLEQLGCDVVGVDVDDEGPVVEQVAGELAAGCRACFVQPRAQNPAGTVLSARRAAELARLLEGTGAIVVEDDHANEISSAPLVSIGAHLPSQTVHVRSFSKSHGPDLRLAAVGGAGDVVTAVANRRLLGPGWSSRILQAVLVELLADRSTTDALTVARDVYARRRAIVAEVLAERDVATTGGDGINLWVAVADERSTVVSLAARGIGVAPGTPFLVRPDGDHVRMTVGLITGDDAEVADVAGNLAAAATGGRRHDRGTTAHR